MTQILSPLGRACWPTINMLRPDCGENKATCGTDFASHAGEGIVIGLYPSAAVAMSQ